MLVVYSKRAGNQACGWNRQTAWGHV